MPIAIFLRIFGAHINILFIIKLKILFLITSSFQSSPNYVDYWAQNGEHILST